MPSPTPLSTNPLEAVHGLVGMDVNSDWKVVEKIKPHTSDTGGNFSVTYLVRHRDGTKAFMKVLNLARALSMPGDQLRNVQYLVSLFNFERDTLDICKRHSFNRVASALLHGKMENPGNPWGVYYIIFEIAENGNLRKHLAQLQALDIVWVLRSLQQTANGIRELHSRNIAHQDVKPSNVLVFGKTGAKVADLGCADIKGEKSPRGDLNYAGDPSYAPIEQLYGWISPQWETRRLGADMYLFGSLVTFLFAQVTMTSAIMDRLYPQHRPGLWPQDYPAVLPYVRHAFGEVMADVRAALPLKLRDQLAQLIESLCDPDPTLRGQSGFSGAARYSFERVGSILNRLAFQQELAIEQP